MLSQITEFRRKRYVNNLVKNGLTLGKDVYLNDGFFLDPAHCHLIIIEDRVVFGPSVSLFAHDASSLKVIGKTLIAPVRICSDVFVGARSVILPGVTIGKDSIVGAGAVVSKEIPEGEVWGGVPAVKITDVASYKKSLELKKGPDFLESEYRQSMLTLSKREEQIRSLEEFGHGFMKAK